MISVTTASLLLPHPRVLRLFLPSVLPSFGLFFLLILPVLLLPVLFLLVLPLLLPVLFLLALLLLLLWTTITSI
jgi:hypothetical protein